MTPILKKVEERLATSVKHFQKILNEAKLQDVNEAQTVTIVTDMFNEIFGWDKYSEISPEFPICGTSCDIAIIIDKKPQFLVEVKAIGLELKENHVRQVVDYAAHEGLDWVVLTNGINWRIYKVSFGKPIDQELVWQKDFLTLNLKNDEDRSSLYLLSKEGWQKNLIRDFAAQKVALDRFMIAAVVLSEPLLDAIHKELKRACPETKVEKEQIAAVLKQEVLKGEVTDGEKADDARKKVAKASGHSLRAHTPSEAGKNQCEPPPSATSVQPLPPLTGAQ
jgi:hypothetical protein